MFLNKQGLSEKFDEVYFDLSQVPVDTIKFRNDLRKSYDGSNFLEIQNLSEYIFDSLKDIQPKSYHQLMQGKFFYAIDRTLEPADGDITQFGILVNDRAFYIRYFPKCYAEKPNYHEFHAIPDFILKSWLYRTDRWSVAEDTFTNIYKSRLPSTLKMSIKSVISDFDSKKHLDKNADFLTEKFHHEYKRSDDTTDMKKYFDLQILLDTRNTDEFAEKSGYQLFVSTKNDKEIYIIRDADVFTIKKLDNAQDAIDSYAAHLFSGAHGEFGFSQYSVDF